MTSFLHSRRGQATVEMMIILVILFSVLAISFFLFATQQNAANELDRTNSAQRNAQLLAQNLIMVGTSPVGSNIRLFIPPGPAAQTLRVRSGYVEVLTGQDFVTAPIPWRGLALGPFTDGSTITITKVSSATLLSAS